MKCKLHTDLWADLGVVYTVISYSRRGTSTAVELTIQQPHGTMLRTVALHQIEWIEEDES